MSEASWVLQMLTMSVHVKEVPKIASEQVGQITAAFILTLRNILPSYN
jgi:hypothetical protein